MNKIFVQKKITGDTKQRLDLEVAAIMEISRSRAQKLITEGLVLVNKALENSSYIVGEGELIKIYKKTEKVRKIPKIEIIYEDEDIIVIDKPAGVNVHPSAGEKEITISEIFSKKIEFVDNSQRAGIVHRLDKGTSGVMVLAKTERIQKILQNEFKKRKVKKTYLALVEGTLKPDEGVIDIPLKRESIERKKIGVSTSGKSSITQYKVLKYYKKRTLVELSPKTGRTHQLRVHLSSIGFPIVGDRKYGNSKSVDSNIMLHANTIEFIHPRTKVSTKFNSLDTKKFMDAIDSSTKPD